MAVYYAVSKGELAHSKGKWKKHKYVRKEGNRYIYPEDIEAAKRLAKTGTGLYKKAMSYTPQGYIAKAVSKQAKKDIARGKKKAERAITGANIQYQYAKKNARDQYNRTKSGASKEVNRRSKQAGQQIDAQRSKARKSANDLQSRYNTAKKNAKKRVTDATIAGNLTYQTTKRDIKDTNARAKKNIKKTVKKKRRRLAKYVYKKIAG